MKIEKNIVSSFHYRLSKIEASGEVIELETTFGGEPSLCLQGHGNVMAGVEAAMEGKTAGDIFSVTLEPKQAYGERREGSTQRVPMKHLLGKKKPKVGDIVHINTEQGSKQATVLKVGLKNVDVDANHPLAGLSVQFDIEILSVREATTDEVQHGHAHGVGGHQH